MKQSPAIHWLCKEWKHFAGQSTLNILVGVLDVVCGLLIVWATKLCVDLATGVPHGSWTLLHAAIVLTSLMLFELGLGYAVRWIKAILGVRAKNAMQERLYSRLLRADWQALHRQHSGQLMNRLQDDVGAVSSFLSEQFPGLISALVQFVAAFCFLCWLNRPLALLVAILSPLLIVCARLYMHKMRGYKHDQRNQESSVHALLQETLQQSLVIKTFEQEEMAVGTLASSHASLRDIIRRNTRYSSSAALLVNATFVGGYLLAFFWGILQLNAGLITFGALLAFVQLVGQIQGPIRRLTNYASVFVTTFTAADRLMQVEALPERDLSGFAMPADEVVRMEDVTFCYEGAAKPVLMHWSATFPKDTITAVVGHTGAGKTTLISLLLGLLRPQEGRVVTHPSLFSYVPQGNTLLSGSVRSNLHWGNPEATEEDMLHALKLADAEFVLNAPAGLDMPCGERGSGLSEGQAQRVCIARALLRPAPVLLLDEAFSALDSDTASRIVKNIMAEKGSAFSTIICITHREALIPFADQVLRIPD